MTLTKVIARQMQMLDRVEEEAEPAMELEERESGDWGRFKGISSPR